MADQNDPEEAVPTTSDSQRKLLLDELGGKHNAAQVYDERLWTIRTGFLTLSFASWGAVIALGSWEDVTIAAIPLLMITLALAVGGLIVDLFYVHRKLRCVHTINAISEHLFLHPPGSEFPAEASRWLLFSGDDPDIAWSDIKNRKSAIVESALIYVLPAVGFVLAWATFWLANR